MAILVVTGTHTATGNGIQTFVPGARQPFNFAVWGTFVGTVVLEKSFDAGVTWLQVYDSNNNAVSLTAPGARCINEPEDGVLYRARCSAFTSGTISYRLSY